MVILSVHLSVTTWYQSKTRGDKDFGFSPHDSLLFLVFRDNFIPLGKGNPQEWRGEKGAPPFKKALFYCYRLA